MRVPLPCTCKTPCERSSAISFICAWLWLGMQRSRFMAKVFLCRGLASLARFSAELRVRTQLKMHAQLLRTRLKTLVQRRPEEFVYR